eukprot:6415428-Prymnesium_polylepis.1
MHEMAMKQRQMTLRRKCFGSAANEKSIRHSFGEDQTHNICCLLGPQSKQYADSTGNPIGTAASKIDYDTDQSHSAWPTCLGSNVCGYYGQKFDDTVPQFAVSPSLNKFVDYIPKGSPNCEAYVAQLLNTTSHGTPGIQTRGDASKCSEIERAKIRLQLLTSHNEIQQKLNKLDPTIYKAVCVLHPNESDVSGIVFFQEVQKHHVRVIGTISNLTPGVHGFHIHEFGDLTNGCKSACSHLNPYGTKHGGPHDKERHVGDLGNIEANESGQANIDFIDDQIRLRRFRRNIVGRMLVIHADEDDLGRGHDAESKKTGNAGSRIACGVIGYRK